MSDLKAARMRGGGAYAGHKQYLGNGILRSCNRCGKHHPPGNLRHKAPFGACCPACRGVAT